MKVFTYFRTAEIFSSFSQFRIQQKVNIKYLWKKNTPVEIVDIFLWIVRKNEVNFFQKNKVDWIIDQKLISRSILLDNN